MDEGKNTTNPVYSKTDTSKLNLSEEEWQKILPKDVYSIARLKGTERAWSSKFENFKEIGTYHCAACGMPCLRVTPNLTADADGQVFMSRFQKPASFTSRIILTA
jgi:peptide-methionine (R)-S-oxide reductase